MLLIPKALHPNSSPKEQAEWRENRKNVRMVYGEIKGANALLSTETMGV